MSEIKNIAVIGAGNMGHQIALQSAIQGFTVKCTDTNPEILQKANQFVDEYLAGRVNKQRLSAEQASAARERIRFVDNLEAAVSDADYVIEAILEVLEIKRAVFKQLDQFAPPHAILASNSSAIVSSKIADATQRPDKVLNLHFFNPALVMKLVEVVQGPHVSDDTIQQSLALCEQLNKVPVHLKKEVEGFLLNRIFGAINREANWLLEMGVASFEDIDKACVHGAGHPMGPFRLNDLTGIDLSYIMATEAFKVSGDPADLPTPQLVERYARGDYGEKVGRGWYRYDEE